MNKNAGNTLQQINNTLEILISQGIVKYIQPCRISEDKNSRITSITWNNHVGGRNVSGKAFNAPRQYFSILSSNAYQAIMIDYSIVRVSFTFEKEKLVAQNLLWWPCPVKMDDEMESEFGLCESVKVMLEDIESEKYLTMRTPIRIDFDSTNNSFFHPRAHTHIQHHDSRINNVEPICFNRFMKFILDTHYPYLKVDYRGWNYLDYQYDGKHIYMDYNSDVCLLYK